MLRSQRYIKDNIILKRIVSSCLLVLIGSPEFALAGFADEMEESNMNLTAITIVLVIAQIICYLIIRFYKHERTWTYKKKIVQITNRIHKKKWTIYLYAWLLSTFIWNPYLSVFIAYFILGIISFVLWIIYCIFVLKKKLRIKYLTGKNATANLLSIMFQQIIGYILYIIICCTPITALFKREVNEFEGEVFYIYPSPVALAYIIEGFLGTAFFFAIPYIVIAIIRLLKLCTNKIIHNYKKKHV